MKAQRSDWLLVLSLVAAVGAACSATESASPKGAGGSAGAAGSDASAGAAGVVADAGDDVLKPDKTVVVIGPGADADSPQKFGGPDDPYAKPELVYPADGVLVPPNMRALDLHFKPGTGQTLFEIRFESPAIAVVVYVGCKTLGSGCEYATDKDFWDNLVPPNRGAAPVSYRIRGVNGGKPYGVGTSDTHGLAFSKEDINGGLYYWNTSGILQRYDFGLPLQQAEQYMTPQMAGALTCVGCHALSRDGKRMAIGADIPAPAPYKVYDVATRKPLGGEAGVVGGVANFFSFSPDAAKLLFSDGVKIGMQDVASGAIDNPSLIALGTMPDWSPDGQLMVYAKPAVPPPFGLAQPGVSDASLEVVTKQGNGFGAPSVLVPYYGQNNFYPSFAPTQKWVIFNRSPSNQNSYSAPDGELWTARVGTGSQIRLDNANQGGSCSWAKWAPDVGSYYGGTVMWLTFSSPRAYGLKLGQSQVQLWMVGFDPKRAEQGQDPSFPAFWFPYQDPGGGNHIAQWVTTVERQPCIDKSECQAGEICDNGKCIPVVK